MLKSLKRIIKSYILPYKPLSKSKTEWDKEYLNSKWNYLNNSKDSVRYGVIVNYIRDNFDNSVSILDLGCGSAILLKKLSGYYSHYTGVDISDDAIKLARTWEDDKTEFHPDDLMNFTPGRIYDCIIFNESLYYFDKPLKLLSKYKPFLNKNGVIIISMWDYKERNNKLWNSINSIFDCIDGVHIKLDSGNSWFIRFYRDNR